MLVGCDVDSSVADAPEASTAAPQIAAASARLTRLNTSADGIAQQQYVVLIANPDLSWSAAFRLLCRDCTQALAAFGHTELTASSSRIYDSIDVLRADNRLDERIPIVDLPIDPPSTAPAVLAAFRVVDASAPEDPRYLVRLREQPDVLYETMCESFLRVGQGSLKTVPISKQLLAHWGVPATRPRIACAAFGSGILPTPARAEAVTPPREVPAIAGIWTATQQTAGVSTPRYPYLVTRDASGALRGFPIDCGAEAFSALHALGFAPSDVVQTPATRAELDATHFGEQPALRCPGLGGARVIGINSENDSAKRVRFKFDDQPGLVEFACAETEAHWKQQVRSSDWLEVPYQALAYLDAGRQGDTPIFKIGCHFPQPLTPPAPFAAGVTDYHTVTGDFNADGRADLLTWSPNAVGGWASWGALELSDGDGFRSVTWPMGAPVSARKVGANPTYATLAADFDGDHRTDVAVLSPNAAGAYAQLVTMDLSSGNLFSPTAWPAETPRLMRAGGLATYLTFAGDFDGDGLSDLATLSPNAVGSWTNTIALELSKKNGFRSSSVTAYTPVHMRNGNADARYFVRTGDFDGDGRTDLATITPDAVGDWNKWVAIELARDGGFVSQVWPAQTPMRMRNGGRASTYQVLAADFNGDGKTDLATISKDASWPASVSMELSTGSGFTSAVWPAATMTHMRNGGSGAIYDSFATDLDADGRADLLTISKTGGGGWSDWMAVERSTGAGFRPEVWRSPTPQHIRNGDPGRDYRLLVGDFDGNQTGDLAVVSPNGGGAWSAWLTLDRAIDGRFEHKTWTIDTPAHMRRGVR